MNFLDHLWLINDEQENGYMRNIRRRNATPDSCFDLADNQFVKLFRLNKGLADELLNTISPFMKEAYYASFIDEETKMLAALRFFASGSYQMDVGNSRDMLMSQPSVSRALKEVTDAFMASGIFQSKIKFPNSIDELETVQRGFQTKFGFPGVVGSVDGTHVAIVAPSRTDDYVENIFVNRKQYHSLNVQLIADSDLRILHVNARYPGSTHDSYIWRNSNISQHMQNIHIQREGMYYLLGDSGYPLRPWLLTPFRNPTERCDRKYNAHHMRARNCSERCNGVLKLRFRCLLKHRTLHYQPNMAALFTNCCCVLHNMCRGDNLPDVPGTAEDLSAIQEGYMHRSSNEASNTVTEGQRFRSNIVRQYFSN